MKLKNCLDDPESNVYRGLHRWLSRNAASVNTTDTERERTSVPIVISRSSGSKVRRGRNVRDGVGPRRKAFKRFEGLCQRNVRVDRARVVYVSVVARRQCY